MKASILTLATAAGMVLAPVTAYPYSVYVLESFENGIDNVVPIGDRAVLSHYTKEHDFDTRVTHGNHALQVELLTPGWGEDLRITLSAEATAILQAAWNPHPVTGEKPKARYLLKYDITFPPSGVVEWLNHNIHNNWEPYQEHDTVGHDQAPLTVAVPLDLLPGSLSVNEDGTAGLTVINNGAWADGNVPVFFIDNIRLVDVWTSEAPPTTTLVEDFDEQFRVWAVVTGPDFSTVSMDEYEAEGPDDGNVTSGSRSLEITLHSQGWGQAFVLDLNTAPGAEKLAEILRLPEEERVYHTFRFDVIFQPVPDTGWGGDNWGYKFGTSLSQADTARMPSRHASYSVNMASMSLDPDWMVINFIRNGGFAGDVVSYFDNFRIIHTDQEGPELIFPPVPHQPPVATAPVFAGISFDAAAGELTLTWDGEAGQTYRLFSSTDLVNWDTIVADNYPEGGAPEATVSITVPVTPADQVLFFQVAAIQ